MLMQKHVKRLGKLSDELYRRIMAHVSWQQPLDFKTRMIHLADAVDCGTITPMDAYEVLSYLKTSGYLPEFITARESNYSHLL